VEERAGFAIRGIQQGGCGESSDSDLSDIRNRANDRARASLDAYTGSPSEWTVDDRGVLRPDETRVGMGEGTQAYTFGLYSAEDREVASGYSNIEAYGPLKDRYFAEYSNSSLRDSINAYLRQEASGVPNVSMRGPALQRLSLARDSIFDAIVGSRQGITGAEYGRPPGEFEGGNFSEYEESMIRFENLIPPMIADASPDGEWIRSAAHRFIRDFDFNNLEVRRARGTPSVYGLIHDVNREDLLDLDAPLFDQSDKVMKALESVASKYGLAISEDADLDYERGIRNSIGIDEPGISFARELSEVFLDGLNPEIATPADVRRWLGPIQKDFPVIYRQLVENNMYDVESQIGYGTETVMSEDGPRTGRDAVLRIAYKYSEMLASQALQSEGIPGVQFLDRNSRGLGHKAKDATRNFVMYGDRKSYVDPERTDPSLTEGRDLGRPWRTTGPGGTLEFQHAPAIPMGIEREVLSGQPFSTEVQESAFDVIVPPNTPEGDSTVGNASWFRVNFDANGQSSESGMPLVVLSGHHEPAQYAPDNSEIKERGFGASHIESHNDKIRDLTPYGNWQELVMSFSRAMGDFPAKVKTGEITPYAEPGSVSYIWNDPSSEADNILIHTVNASKEGLGDVSYLVSAYPTDTFSVVGGSRRNKTGHLHGPDASVESVKTFLNPGNARKFGDSDRRRHAVDSYEGRPPKVREAMEQVLGRSRTKNMRTLWGSLGEALRSTDKSMIDKWTAMTMNRFKRIERYGEWAREKASKLGLEGLHDLADVSAHSMALMSDKAQSLLASSMRDGILTYRHGVPMVETLKLVTEARAKVIDPTTGDLVDGDLISIPDLYSEGQTGGMFPMLEALATPSKNLIPELMLYMRALRGYRLDREGRSSGLSKESIEAGFEVAKDNPEIVVVAQNLQNWNEGIIQLQVDAGLITKEMGDVYRKYSDYIPFYLNLEDTTTDAIEDVMLKELGRRDEMFLAGGIANQNPSRKFKGIREGAEFENPIESITKNAKAAIHSSLQNIASQRAIRDALMLGLAKEVRSSDRSKLGFSDRGRMVTVRHRGEPRHFLLDDPLFHEAMVGAFDGISPWMEHMGMPARVLRGLVTRSPEYLIANMLRDSMHVYILNGGESTPIIDASKAMTKNLAKMPKGEANETYTLLQRLGVVSGVEQAELTPERLANRFARKTGEGSGVGRLLTKLWDVTGEMSSRSESATRENVYETTYQHALKKYSDMGFNYVDSNGINVAERKAMGEAANQAIEVLNFSRRGNNGFVKFVTATVPFLNSRLQGLGVMARSLMGNSITGRLNPDATKRVMINRAMTVSTISALYAIMSEMDEDWDNIPSEIRENNWLIPITFEDKRWLSIPIPFEAGVAWKAIPEMITRLIMGQLSDGRSGTSSKEFFESFWHHVGSTLNFNPLPQALRPLYEWLANQNIFTGNPIVPHWQENMKASEQFGDSTTAQAILAGKMTGLSPKKIDNTMKTIFGGVGIWGIQIVDFMLRQGIPDMPTRPAPRLTDLPIIRRFVKDAYGPGLKNDFYDIRSSVRGVVQAINQAKGDDPERAAELIMDNRELLSARKAVGVIDKRLSKIRKARSQAFRNNTLTREMDDKLDEMEKEALKMVPTLKRMIAGWE